MKNADNPSAPNSLKGVKVISGLEAETLLEEYSQTKCPCCDYQIIPYTIGRVSYCPVCKYTWNVTCLNWLVNEKPELREFHLSVWKDYLLEKNEIRKVELLKASHFKETY